MSLEVKVKVININHQNVAIEEGIKEGSMAIAKKMKENGETIDNIVLYTGLSIDEIERA